MKQPELDENGLPVKGSRNASGMLSVKLSDEDWGRVGDLITQWSKENRIRLSIGDAIRACIIQAHKRMSRGLQQGTLLDVPEVNGAPDVPPKGNRPRRSRRPTPGGT